MNITLNLPHRSSETVRATKILEVKGVTLYDLAPGSFGQYIAYEFKVNGFSIHGIASSYYHNNGECGNREEKIQTVVNYIDRKDNPDFDFVKATIDNILNLWNVAKTTGKAPWGVPVNKGVLAALGVSETEINEVIQKCLDARNKEAAEEAAKYEQGKRDAEERKAREYAAKIAGLSDKVKQNDFISGEELNELAKHLGVSIPIKTIGFMKRYVAKVNGEGGSLYVSAPTNNITTTCNAYARVKAKLVTGETNESDLLPTVSEYSEFLHKICAKTGMEIEEARQKYGLFSVKQWNELLGKES